MIKSISQWDSFDGNSCFIFKDKDNLYYSRFWKRLPSQSDLCLAVRLSNIKRFYLEFKY